MPQVLLLLLFLQFKLLQAAKLFEEADQPKPSGLVLP